MPKSVFRQQPSLDLGEADLIPNTNASVFAANEFFQKNLGPFTQAQLKTWNGSAWISKPLKTWNGASWIVKPMKAWNSLTWITVT